eukprot:TRINITY_DN3418_c0_g1_i6.p1 TRINITY_DN3418_c0_g1~~TRINITY_DN3418_c0_g1_i6.p1  ORF type:complete len:719 (-),score=209.20 TRINITY_DN3418_c0_g1_i6:101-2257(-)
MKKSRGRGRGALTGTEEAAMAARRAGLLDAYTESPNQAMSDSDKFKEGYKKKGKKEKSRKSESEDSAPILAVVPPAAPQEDEGESWDKDEEIVDSWEDIDAPVMPVPQKVKQEQRKQEKMRKKEEEKRHKQEVATLSKQMESVKIEETKSDSNAAESAKQPPSGGGKSAGAGGKDAPKPSPEAVKSEREAKKAAKAAAKNAAKNKKDDAKGQPDHKKTDEKSEVAPPSEQKSEESTSEGGLTEEERKKLEKAKRKAEFEAKRAAELAAKGEASSDVAQGGGSNASGQQQKSKAELKAERRAKQEQQRAAKAQAQEQKKTSAPSKSDANSRVSEQPQGDQEKGEKKGAKQSSNHNVLPKSKAQKIAPLFSHLRQYERENAVTKDLPVTGGNNIHPSIVTLGLQLIEDHVVGCERKCLELLRALQDVVISCVSEIKNITEVDLFKEIDSVLKPNLDLLQQCRPLSISMENSVRAVKAKLKSLDSMTSQPLDEILEEVKSIFTSFVEENLNLAAKQISLTAGKRIQNGDVILTYAENDLVEQILIDASKEKKFRVIVADGRVQLTGSKMAARLISEGIETTYILVSAVSQLLPTVTKVFLGCEGVMANGGVLAQVGTSQVALLAESVGVPVLMCCQSFKFTERVQTDSFVYNELLDPDQVAKTPGATNFLEKWKDQNCVHLLNLAYDVTPASLVSAVITEISVVPTTSVPVILRLKNCDVY